MASHEAALERRQTEALTVAKDLAALLGFSAAVAITAGVIRTPMQLPGHSAIFWLPVLVLAAFHRRPGMAVGAAMLGGLGGAAFGHIGGLEYAQLIAAAGLAEGLGGARAIRSRTLRVLLAAICGHLGKLGLKLVAGVAMGVPLNAARLPILPTFALYAAFGLVAGAETWALLALRDRLRRN